MPVISLNLKTLQPLLATSFQGDPNSDVSYDYIPGSMIRGALIGRYLKNYGASELDLTKEEVKRLFFDSNKTRYLNAYLRSKKGKHRTLPIPQSWYKQKGDEFIGEQSISIYDLSIEKDDEQDDKPKPLKSVSGQFCTVEQGYMQFYQPDRRINIHNQRDRRKGRSSKREDRPDSEGAIFRYDALDVGQVFQSIILCEENDLPLFEKLLTQSDLWLGGSRSAGYGHTLLSYEIHNDLDWQEVQTFGDDELDSDDIVVTLL
uniref:RAMP superfamily CRISPR-associated protein n=1 Tax=Spirulina sp. CCY15215 TaxID=2767591 RepID=UPI0019508AAD